MSNPLVQAQFKHYLNFKSDDLGLFQIAEPLKFDASEFVIEQDSKFYARDISFMNEEIDLQFIEGFFGISDEQYQTLDGSIVSQLSHCLDYILEYNKRFGFQSQIEYILERNGTQFVVGELNFEGADTDELTFFNCKVVQNTKRALAKRREDVEIDGFSDEDIDGEYIEPLQTHKLLLKAKPDVKKNNYLVIADTNFYQTTSPFTSPWVIISNPFKNTIQSDIENTITGLNSSAYYLGNFGDSAENKETIYNFGFIDAISDLTNLIVNIELSMSYYIDVNADINDNWESVPNRISIEAFKSTTGSLGSDLSFIESYTIDMGTPTYIGIEDVSEFTNSPFVGNAKRYDYNFNYEFNISEIQNGQRLSMYLRNRRNSTLVNYKTGNLSITATSIAIDTVVDACRYEDILKHSLKAINGMDMVVPEFDLGGQFHNLFAFSGNMIRQRTDVPFYFNFKDRRENFHYLTNGDVQINEDDAFAIQYDDFYSNVENGAFLTATNDNFSMSYNNRYSVNLLDFSFKEYEKDDDEENTLDAVHTESQYSINNTRVQTTKKIEVSDIFDPFRIEKQRRDSYKETTALEGDDKIHGIDAVPLAPSERGGFTASMTHNIDEDGRVNLLKDANLPSWALLGFGIGSQFKIVSGLNDGDYEVYETTSTIITLTPISPSTQSGTGVSLTEVEYPFDNVLYTNRTNEGFDIIENLLNPDKFSNLKYTIRRILYNWERYLSTCSSFITDPIKNTMFKNNGLLKTQFNGGPIYIENEEIPLSSLQERILSPRVYEVSVIADYDKVLEIISKYQNIDTAGGFIRVQGTKGDIKKLYPQKLSYSWVNELLTIVGEERREPDFVTITKSGSIIFVDEVGYDIDELLEVIYEANGDYFTLLDNSKRKIINFTKYDRFIVEGQTFNNSTDLAQALIEL